MPHATINAANLHYETHGSGPAVLLIHGFPLSAALWKHCVAPLSRHYQLILPDLRGMGQSQPTGTISMSQYADDLAGLLDHLHVTQPVYLGGLSMGGYVAFEFIRRHPNRVAAVGLFDTRHQPDSPQKAAERETLAVKVLDEGSHVVATGMLPHLFGKAASQALKDEWHAIMASTPPQGVAGALRAMANRVDSSATLDAIKAPTLILCGEEDVITPPDVHKEMHQRIAGSTLHVMAGAGHMTPVETPETFVQHLSDHLNQCMKG